MIWDGTLTYYFKIGVEEYAGEQKPHVLSSLPECPFAVISVC